MDLLKKLFPLSFKFIGEVASLVIGVIIYVVAGAVFGGVFGWLAGIVPYVGFLFGILGSLASIYCTAGIVIEFLVHFGVIKD